MNLELTEEEYTALVALSRRGCTSSEQLTQLDAFLLEIEKRNGITRYFLRVRWQDGQYPLPPNTRFPEVWPPMLEVVLERADRPISRVDILTAVEQKSVKPVTIMFTTDPAGLVGWTQLDTMYPP